MSQRFTTNAGKTGAGGRSGRFLFFPRLAITSMRKNRKLYLPYLLTCVGTVMMYYMISFLSTDRYLSEVEGGRQMQSILSFGIGVMAVFAAIFLFYTDSFLIRRRKKEFGLYNILGMDKKNLAALLLWETLILYVVSVAGGLALGVLFSKIAQLIMIKMLGAKASFTFSVDFSSLALAAALFAVIFLAICLNALRQIRKAKPVELFVSESYGEKPPKANALLAVLGFMILLAAYTVTLVIQNPMAALTWFFLAVILVIIATYMLFITGSVFLCNQLKKWKRYYYRTDHFVSVSSMRYRMKRNGAGLASICILSTMVLVMLSSTACLYAGMENSIKNRYPRDIVINTHSFDGDAIRQVEEATAEVLAGYGVKEKNTLHYRYLDVGGLIQGDQVIFDRSRMEDFSLTDISGICQLLIVPLEDYIRLTGDEETLAADEVILCCRKVDYREDSITLEGCGTLRVKKQITSFPDNGVVSMQVIPSIFLFVPDLSVIQQVFEVQRAVYGDDASVYHDYHGFDLSCGSKMKIEIEEKIRAGQEARSLENPAFPKVLIEGVESNRQDFYALYGGLFFLGILLGLVFLCAVVLLMYYKQITEGYEDERRFEIMQKVGMTKKEVQRSINAQVRTVFLLPLLLAGIHVAVALPIIEKIMRMLMMNNVMLYVVVTVICYLIFGVFYMGTYLITSRSYFGIVSGGRRELF